MILALTILITPAIVWGWISTIKYIIYIKNHE
jgi:hypothetical protein